MKKNIVLLALIIIILAIAFINYLINRYLTKNVETVISNNGEKIAEEYEATENTYKSDELEIKIDKVEKGEGNDKVTYFVADIKNQNPSRLKRAFAKDKFGTNITEQMKDIVDRKNAILAINGDYYGFRDSGIEIADSEIYRNVSTREALAIYDDGRMEIYDELKIASWELIQKGIKDTLSFGPVLVREGIAQTGYTEYAVDTDNIIRTNIAEENPRTGIGYYDPNHYCFVVVDGRNEGYSKGVTLDEFAKIFEELGCDMAYNLDGGSSTNIYFMGNKINKSSVPGGSERPISDILYID